MYSSRKYKSSFFLRDDPYPERVLSRHRHCKKSRVYDRSRSLLGRLPANPGAQTPLANADNSKMLLEGIPQLYFDSLSDREGVSWHRLVKTKSLPKATQISNQREAVSMTDSQLVTQARPLSEQPDISQNEGGNRDKRSVIVTSKMKVLSQKGVVDTKERGLQDMETSSFTNGLLESGRRYFCVL